ncbi:MAG: hypothetical protein Q9191_003217 [Dirinaria sp. TL-2023a]
MSVQNSLRLVFAGLARPARHCLRRNLHTSPKLHGRTPKHKSIKARDMILANSNPQEAKGESEEVDQKENGLIRMDAETLSYADTLSAYTQEQKALLRDIYTKEQVASIEAGEAAIDPKDLEDQAVVREDRMGLPYFDDLSSIHPVVDKPIRAPEENYDLNQRFKTEDELLEDMVDWFKHGPEKPNVMDFAKFQQNQRLTVGKEEAERNPRNYLAPNIPVIPSLANRIKRDDVHPDVRRVMLQTGYSEYEIRAFRTKAVVTNRVANQTRMGKQYKLYCLFVAGNGKGLLGIGEGKAAKRTDALRIARYAAIRSMQPIHRYEERTIYGDLHGKSGGTEVELMTRTPGFGLRCQGIIYEICRCVGISDIAARVSRSRNPMNTVKATVKALLSQQLPEDVARARGRKLIDVRKVYYAGSV